MLGIIYQNGGGVIEDMTDFDSVSHHENVTCRRKKKYETAVKNAFRTALDTKCSYCCFI